MRRELGAEVHAAAVLVGGKRVETKVPGLHRARDVFPPDATPAHEIFLGDQNAPVVPGAAARAAGQTIELVGFHGVEP